MLKNSKGQSLVEMAMVMPVLLLVLTAIIDFGLLFNHYSVISNATREAARLAAVGGEDSEINALISNLTGTLESTDITIVITPESTRVSGEDVSVEITYDNELITPIIGSLLGGDITLRSETHMRVE